MAVAWIGQVLRGVHGIPPVQKLILIVLADYARAEHDGVCWPSIATIASEVGIVRSQVSEHLSRLRRLQWIEPVGTTRGGRGRSTRWRLNLARIAETAVRQKHTATRTVSGDGKDPDSRAVIPAETIRFSDPNDLVQRGIHPVLGAETIRPTGYEPLNLSRISNGFEPEDPTSNPIKKNLTRKPGNPPQQEARSHMSRQEQTACVRRALQEQEADAEKAKPS